MFSEGYLYIKNDSSSSTSTPSKSLGRDGIRWSRRFCSILVDPKRGPYLICRKRVEDNYKDHANRIEDHVPFASSVLKLINYEISVENDIIKLSDATGHLNLDTVELREKTRERAREWARAMMQSQQGQLKHRTPAKSKPTRDENTLNGEHENPIMVKNTMNSLRSPLKPIEKLDDNKPAAMKSIVKKSEATNGNTSNQNATKKVNFHAEVDDSNSNIKMNNTIKNNKIELNKDGSPIVKVKDNSMAKLNANELVKTTSMNNAALKNIPSHFTLITASPSNSSISSSPDMDKSTTSIQTHMTDDSTEFKERVKAKATSQVLLIESKRRHDEEKAAEEEESKRKLARDHAAYKAQKEMAYLLAEAENREKEKQRLLSESQLQAEEFQKKALDATQRAEEMVQQNESEISRLMEAANAKKALTEKLRVEQETEEHNRQIREEMERQLELQRQEREKQEREALMRKRNEDEISALKAALDKKLKGTTASKKSSSSIGAILLRGMAYLLCIVVLGTLLFQYTPPKTMLKMTNFGTKTYTMLMNEIPKWDHDSTSQSSSSPTSVRLEDLTESSWDIENVSIASSDGVSAAIESSNGVSATLEFLQKAPQSDLVAALNILADAEDTGLTNDLNNYEYSENSVVGLPNVFRSLLRAITSPLRMIHFFWKSIVG